MQVITYDPYVSDDVLKRANVRRVELDELIRTSDYISLHCPLTPRPSTCSAPRLPEDEAVGLSGQHGARSG